MGVSLKNSHARPGKATREDRVDSKERRKLQQASRRTLLEEKGLPTAPSAGDS